ncbi:MAG: hypothetical protein CMI60_08210 [Parvibaculum sp.]|nr:hypothetical protein [Parvibaculum sp.]
MNLDLREDLKCVEFDPVLHVLRRSRAPAVLAEKWERFERYTHSTNRLDLTPDGPDALVTRFGAVDVPPEDR